jgi:hypothetical protein
LLVIYGFTSRSRIFHLYGDVTIAGEGLQNLGLPLAPLSREGSLSCHTCCDTGPRFFRSLPKDRPIQSPFTTQEGVWRIYSNPDPHGFFGRGSTSNKETVVEMRIWCIKIVNVLVLHSNKKQKLTE